MSEHRGFRKFIIVSILCVCPALVLAGGESGDRYEGDISATVWAVFFNDPSACATVPCSDVEFMREGNPAGLDVCYFTGATAPNYGWSAFGGSFAEGSNFGCIFSGLGLVDAETAEIHFVVQTHGRKRGDILTDQVTEFVGGCPPNTCRDVHFAIHVAAGEFETVSNVYRFKNGHRVWGATSTLRRFEDGIKMALNDKFDEGKDWYGFATVD